MQIIVTNDASETIKLGEKIATSLNKGDIICIEGELGVGKTTLIKGICNGLKVKDYVTSPSFVIITKYEGRLPIYHIDLYRIDSEKITDLLDLEEIIYSDEAVVLIEWAEKIKDKIEKEYLSIKMKRINENKREIVITPNFGYRQKSKC